MKLSDCYILSDVDGTLLPTQKEIPARNIEALTRFTGQGGHFGLATGRSKEWTQYLVDQLPVNAPCALYNGGVVYDFSTGETLLERYLQEEAKQYMVAITRRMPEIGALVVTGDSSFNVKDEIAIAEFTKSRNDTYHAQVDWQEITTRWYKVLFLIQDGVFDSFFAYVNSQDFPGVRFVGTNPTLIEMLPELSSKGDALRVMMKARGVARENMIAIGDFYNDLEMIETAGIGVTLETAPEDLKAKADVVVGTCLGGALADLVEHLEQEYPY